MSEAQMAALPSIFANLSMSAAMEGLTLTEQIKAMCLDVLNGECTLEECLTQLNDKYDREG